MYFYSDTKKSENTDINVWKMNGTKAYLRHYDNLLFLQFVANNSRSSAVDRRQAEAEIVICNRKLDFWAKHPKYDHDDALKGIQAIKRNWSAER